MRVRFGECVLDSETRQLLVQGQPVHLSPKGLRFLELLLENRPRALSKEEIHRQLWSETFVSDGTLTSLLAEVRAAIGDGARQSRFIRTVHRHGYAFSGRAEEAAPRRGRRPRFAYRLFIGSREMALGEGQTILGRDPEVGAFIDHTSVSRQHARITIVDGEATIEDLGSKNGTRVNSARISGVHTLADGDEIRIGSVTLTFRTFPLSGSTATADSRA